MKLILLLARMACTCFVLRRQLTSLLLRWTNAADAGVPHDSGKDQPPENVVPSSPATSSPPAAAAPAEETAGLVAAGLKLVKTVCTKTENNKGQ